MYDEVQLNHPRGESTLVTPVTSGESEPNRTRRVSSNSKASNRFHETSSDIALHTLNAAGTESFNGVPAAATALANGFVSQSPVQRLQSQLVTKGNALASLGEFAAACVLSLVVTIGVYVASLLFTGTIFGRIFWSGFPIPLVITLLAFYALARLAFKRIGLFLQMQVFQNDLVPLHLGTKITVDNVQNFERHIEQLPSNSTNILANRVREILAHFRSRRTTSELGSFLDSQTQAEFSKQATTFSSINLIIWALPILGFLGTVIGISASVGEFSGAINAAGDLEIIKTSLGGVTQGLAVSFETTLLALLFSMMVMFPKAAVVKQSERHLLQIEEYCRNLISQRLQEPVISQSGSSKSFIKAFDQILNRYQEQWAEQTETMVRTLAREFAASVGKRLDETVAASLSANTEIVQKLQAGISKSFEESSMEQQKNLLALKDFTSNAASQHQALVTDISKLQTKQVQELGQVLTSIQAAAVQIKSAFDLVQPVHAESCARLSELAATQRQFVDVSSNQIQKIQSLAQDVRRELQATAEQMQTKQRIDVSEEMEQLIRDTRSFTKATVKELRVISERLPSPDARFENNGNWLGRLLFGSAKFTPANDRMN